MEVLKSQGRNNNVSHNTVYVSQPNYDYDDIGPPPILGYIFFSKLAYYFYAGVFIWNFFSTHNTNNLIAAGVFLLINVLRTPSLLNLIFVKPINSLFNLISKPFDNLISNMETGKSQQTQVIYTTANDPFPSQTMGSKSYDMPWLKG